MDLSAEKIDNLWILTGLILGVIERVFGGGGISSAIPDLLMGFFLPIVLLGSLYLFRMIGAGDIKLFCCIGVIAGWHACLACILWSFLFGAVISIYILCTCGDLLQRLQFLSTYIQNFILTKKRVPYIRPDRAGRETAYFHFTVPIFMSLMLWAGGIYS